MPQIIFTITSFYKYETSTQPDQSLNIKTDNKCMTMQHILYVIPHSANKA